MYFSVICSSYWLNLCQGVHDGPVGCPQDAAVCWRPADGSGVRPLARVTSQTISIDGECVVLLCYGVFVSVV